jgi:hypothetical protein
VHPLGQGGPFPEVPLGDDLQRRWLHYAFRSQDGELSMIANLSSLGASDPSALEPQQMSIMVVHERASGWHATQFNAQVIGEPWSAFRLPNPGPRLRIRGAGSTPKVDLLLRRTGHGCTSQCAAFAGDQHLRWQSEPGIRATGDVSFGSHRWTSAEMVGYHERVRGRWSWPDLGGWVFGFANAGSDDGRVPPFAVVFTLIQPLAPADAATGSVMLWRHGRLLRHFPRRTVDVAVADLLPPDDVVVCPPLAVTLGARRAPSVPRRLVITASMGEDRLCIDLLAYAAARIVNPSESGLLPFSVHEVLASCVVSGAVAGATVDFRAGAIVEFAGGAVAD